MTFYSFMKQMYDARPEHVLFSYDREGIQTNVMVRQWVGCGGLCGIYGGTIREKQQDPHRRDRKEQL